MAGAFAGVRTWQAALKASAVDSPGVFAAGPKVAAAVFAGGGVVAAVGHFSAMACCLFAVHPVAVARGLFAVFSCPLFPGFLN